MKCTNMRLSRISQASYPVIGQAEQQILYHARWKASTDVHVGLLTTANAPWEASTSKPYTLSHTHPFISNACTQRFLRDIELRTNICFSVSWLHKQRSQTLHALAFMPSPPRVIQSALWVQANPTLTCFLQVFYHNS